MKNKYRCESVRLCRFLYALGFDKESIFKNGKEQWLFEKSPELQESLDFFFYFRKKLKDKRIKGVNENANNTDDKTMDSGRGKNISREL